METRWIDLIKAAYADYKINLPPSGICQVGRHWKLGDRSREIGAGPSDNSQECRTLL